MLRDTEDAEVKAYLTVRLQQAKWVIEGMERRKAALLACVQGILAFQASFFRHGPGYLAPLSLEDAAARAELSMDIMELTIKDKYLQCSSGVYPLSYFFQQ